MKNFATILCLAVAPLTAIAAMSDGLYGARVPVRVWATYEAYQAPGWYSFLGCFFEPTTPGAPNFAYENDVDAPPGQIGHNLGVLPMMPGKTYPVIFEGNDYTFDLPPPTLYVQAPPGYVVQIDGEIRNSKGYGEYDNDIYVRILPQLASLAGPAGTSTGLSSGAILWSVSLGSLLNGTPAGHLSLNDPGIRTDWAPLFTPAFLHFESPNPDEVDVETDPYVTLITTNEAVVEIDTDVGVEGYDMRFYHPAHWNAGSPTADPYVTYQIRRPVPSGTALSITRLSRNITATNLTDSSPRTETTTVTRSGTFPNFSWNVADWSSTSQALTEADNEWTWNSGDSTLTCVATVHAPSGADEMMLTARFKEQSWGGDAMDRLTIGNDSNNLTTFSYYTNTAEHESYGYLQRKDLPGGGWEEITYLPSSSDPWNAGVVQTITRPYLNGDGGATEVTTLTFGEDVFGFLTLPREAVTKVNGTTVRRTKTMHWPNSFSANSLPLVLAERKDFVDANESNALVTKTHYYRENCANFFLRRMVHAIEQPDKVKQSFAYQHLQWDGSSRVLTGSNGLAYGDAGSRAGSRITVITGTSQNTGDIWQTVDGYDIDDLYLIDNKSTKEITTRDERALVIRKETHVWGASGWAPVSAVDYEYTVSGHVKKRTASNGAVYEATWLRGQLVEETDEGGVKLTYAYDVAGRMAIVSKAAAGDVPVLRTKYTYDGAGRMTTQTVGVDENSAPLSGAIVSGREFDTAGRLEHATPPGLGEFTYSYAPATRTRTVEAPDEGTAIESFYKDGRLASVTGTAVVASYLTCGVETDGRQWVRTDIGSSSSPRWAKTWTDQLGRTQKTEQPGFNGQPNSVTETVYHASTDPSPGHLKKSTRTGYAPSRYEYDLLGQLARFGLDLNDNGLEPASNDRITDIDQRFEKIGSDWWLRQEVCVYPYAYGHTQNATKVAISSTWNRLTGHTSGVLSETDEKDAEDNLTTTSVVVNRAIAKATVTTIRDGLDHSDEERVLVNGLPVTVTGHDALETEFEYDTLHRLWKVTDSRGNTSVTAYRSNTWQVETVTDATGTIIVTYTYDELGRTESVKKPVDADHPGNHYAFFAYNSRGQLTHQWGAATVPVEFGYDATYGDRTSMKTFRGGSNWHQATWPSTTGDADTTNWNYHPATGLVHYKTDAASMGTVFGYNQRGQLNYRSWVRRRVNHGYPDPWAEPEAAVITRYEYDSLTGELTNQNYNDDTEEIPTPDVAYTYTRLGQLKNVTDATGTREFVYDPDKPWRLDSEELDGFYAQRVLTRLYETSGMLGRIHGFQLGTTSAPSADLEQTYSFSADGRFDTIVSQRNASSGTNRTFDYGYKTGSTLLETLTSGSFAVTSAYEENRDLLTSISSAWTGANPHTASVFDYTYNALSQRKTAKQSGSAFADYGDGTPDSEAIFRRFTYNTRGELVQAFDYLGDNVTDFSRPLPSRFHEYDYDTAGNRSWANRTGVPDLGEDYGAANNLNQQTSKENTTVAVAGTTAAGASVAVNGQLAAAGQQGRFWSNEYVVANTSAPWSGTLSVFATYNGVVRNETRTARIPRFTQSFTYDLDGNLTSDGIWDYTWDAENRLVRMQTTSGAVSAGYANQRLDFKYDYLGRRVQKLVSTWNGSGWTLASGQRFLYDGWNLVAEYATTGSSLGALQRSYTWGLDVVGSLTATGGVGALVQITDHPSSISYFPTYDGNGNVAALVNADTGALAAAYEYDPYGQPLRAEVIDATVAKQPFRFSTKFTDVETGLIYYGHRYYSPALGRFINRDPIAESGGLNLYGFCGNDGVNGIDVLGMQAVVPVPDFGIDINDGSVDYGDIFLNLDLVLNDRFSGVEIPKNVPAINDKAAPGDENVSQEPYSQATGATTGDYSPERTRGGQIANSESGRWIMFGSPGNEIAYVPHEYYGLPDPNAVTGEDLIVFTAILGGSGGYVWVVSTVSGRLFAVILNTALLADSSDPADLVIPLGLTMQKFRRISEMLRLRAGHISDEIVVHGSRASGTANAASDIDIALRVSKEQFDDLIKTAFGSPKAGTAKWRTMQHAIETGKIQAGEAGLRDLRRAIEKELEIETDVSIILRGGPFDNGPSIPIPPASQ